MGLPLLAAVAALRRHAVLIVLCAVLGAAAAYAYARTLPKSFTASSLIAVAGSGFAIPELQGALRAENTADPMPIVRTEMQALTSHDLIVQVVKELRLDTVAEFNSDLRPPTLAARAKAWVQSFFPSVQGPTGSGQQLDGVVAEVTAAIRMFQDNRSLAIDVGFVSQDPQLSARVANTLVADYIARRARRATAADAGATEALSGRIDQVKNEIASLEAQVQALRTSSGTATLPAGSVGQQQLEDLTSAASKAAVDRGQLEATYNRAVALAGQGSSAALASVLNSGTIAQLREREAAASGRVAELSSRYGGNYPGIAAARAELAAAQGQIASETQRIIASLGAQVRVAREHEADIQKQLADARTVAVASENARAELKRIQDEIDSRRQLYQTMLERQQQVAGAPSADRTPDVYVISAASAPAGPSGPNMKMAAGFGGVGGATLAGLFALLRIRTTDARVPGGNPGAPDLPVAGRLGPATVNRARAGAPLAPEDAAAVTALVASLRELAHGVRPRVVLLTGAARSDDAGTVAALIARAGLLRGDRVLLIDADLAKPGRVPGLPVPPSRDLLALLGGRDWPDPAPATAPSLDHYAPAAAAPGEAALLNEPVFANLLLQARDGFDTVIVLGPPGQAPGVASLARRTDATLVVSGRAAPGPLAERFAGQAAGPVALVMAGA